MARSTPLQSGVTPGIFAAAGRSFRWSPAAWCRPPRIFGPSAFPHDSSPHGTVPAQSAMWALRWSHTLHRYPINGACQGRTRGLPNMAGASHAMYGRCARGTCAVGCWRPNDIPAPPRRPRGGRHLEARWDGPAPHHTTPPDSRAGCHGTRRMSGGLP